MKSPKQAIVNTGKVLTLINKMKAENLMKIEGKKVSTFSALWPDKTALQNFSKNCYLYLRLNKVLQQGETLFVHDIDTGAVIQVYKAPTK